MKDTAVLLVQCPTRNGLNATIAEFLYRYDGNILHFEQHQAGKVVTSWLAWNGNSPVSVWT